MHRSFTRDQIITVYEYDYLGRSIYEESSTAGESDVGSFIISRSHQYSAFRCIFEKEDNYIKRYQYNSTGTLSCMIEQEVGKNEKDPESRKTEFFYDSLGRMSQKKVWTDVGPNDYALECFEYDLLDNVLEKRIEDAQGQLLLRKGFSFDLSGNCTEEYRIENGNKISLIKTFYNFQNEPIGYVDALGEETKVIIDYAYQNSLGQSVLKKTLVDPLGVQTEIEFDALGRLHAIFKKDPMGILLSSEKILYDALGNTSCEIHDQIFEGKIVESQTLRWIYGPMGRLEEEVQAVGCPFEKRTAYGYNSLGKMTSKKIQGLSSSINYTYNKQGHLYKIECQDKKNQISNSYSYDRKGNITSAHCLNGKSVERSYNTFDQVTKETVKDGEGSYTLQYAYDRKGRIKEITLPDNSKIAYVYDPVFGREVKRISAQGEDLYIHTYDHYDDQGKLTQETLIGYTGSQEYAYDLSGEKIFTKSDFFTEKLTRDSLRKVLHAETGSRKAEYAYNALSQLILEKKEDLKTYAYDSLDNRIKVNDEDLMYNSLNQLVSHSSTIFSYDPQGNLLKKVLDGEETHFESNLLAQLTSIEKNQTSTTFSYDPFGRLLVEKQLDIKGKNKKTLSTSRYFYLDYQEIGTLSDQGNIETLKIPGLEGDELSLTCVAIEIKRQTYAPIHDFAGNIAKLIDPKSRQTIESYSYSAFGKETIYNSLEETEETSSIGNPWRFADKRKDSQTGLIFFGLRFYDPTIGRWISQDPAGFLDGPNHYAYLHNDPVNSFDRFGLATESRSKSKFEDYYYNNVETHCYCEKHRTCKRGGDIGKTNTSCLPKIMYCSWYERVQPWYPPSDVLDLDLPNYQDLGIGFTNGIWNNKRNVRKSAGHISRLSGGYNVHAVYNATHDGLDPIECFMGLHYIATEPVRQLHRMWNSFFEKSSKNAKFLMICHSQGAIHVRNALLCYPPELRKRILVVAIAPAAYIYPETCAKVIHYRAQPWRDFIPRIDIFGAMRAKDTIVDLDSHPTAPFFDHTFTSQTYQERLQEHIIHYTNSQGQML